jgi:hypothetical protein
MTENPYESPKCMGEAAIAPTTLQGQATRCFRTLAFVLLLPAVYNYWKFDAHVVSRLPGVLAGNCRWANVLGFVVGVALVWFFGMPALETLARFVRIVFGGRVPAGEGAPGRLITAWLVRRSVDLPTARSLPTPW